MPGFEHATGGRCLKVTELTVSSSGWFPRHPPTSSETDERRVLTCIPSDRPECAALQRPVDNFEKVIAYNEISNMRDGAIFLPFIRYYMHLMHDL